MAAPLPILRGTLDVLVLRALLGGALHGYEIGEWIERQGKQNLFVLDSALYQSLYRLETKRLIDAEWRVTENSRRARYYTITRAGRAHLRAEIAAWQRYASTISSILDTAST